jgi:hypothetical protein
VKASPVRAGLDTSAADHSQQLTPVRSSSFSLHAVLKSSSSNSGISLVSDGFPLVTVNSNSTRAVASTRTLTYAGRRTARPVRALRGPERERRAARQRSDLSERAARTAGRALRGPRTGSTGRKRPLVGRPGTPARTRDDHREDRPDACGAVRGGRRRPAVLYLTFVRTTQERLTLSNSGSTAVARWSL